MKSDSSDHLLFCLLRAVQNRALVDFNLLSLNFDLGMTNESKGKLVDLCRLLAYIDEIAKCFLGNVSFQQQILEMRFNEESDNNAEASIMHDAGPLRLFQGFFHISYAKVLMGSHYPGDNHNGELPYRLVGSVCLMLLKIKEIYDIDPIEWFSSGLISEEFDAPELLLLRLVMLCPGYITEDQIVVLVRSSFEKYSRENDWRLQRIEEFVSMTNISTVPF